MSLDYTGDPTTYHDIVELPTDGDDRDAASVTAPLEAVLDNCAYLKQLKHVQSSIQRQMRNAVPQDATLWNFSSVAGNLAGWVPTHGNDVVTSEVLYFPIEIPHNATITQISVTIDPGGPHPGLPTAMPRWELHSHTPTGNAVLEDQQTDTSANVPAFEAVHVIQKTISVGPISNSTSRYTLKFFSEANTNSRTGLKVTGVRVTFSMTNLDEGAA